MPIRAPVEKGIGCAAVIPAALIGFAGLTDGAGPQGLLGFAELLGWGVVCWAAGLAVGRLLQQLHEQGPRRYWAVPLAIIAVGAFTWIPWWVGLEAPMKAKIAFTTTVQVIGSIAPIALVIAAVLVGRRQQY